MPKQIMVFSRRRADFSPQQYKDYYENNHVRLIRSLLGDAHPLSYTRYYIPRAEDAAKNFAVKYMAFGAEAAGELDFDCIAVSIFRDQAHLEYCMAKLNEPGKKEQREQDEAKFLELSSLRVVVTDMFQSLPPHADERM